MCPTATAELLPYLYSILRTRPVQYPLPQPHSSFAGPLKARSKIPPDVLLSRLRGEGSRVLVSLWLDRRLASESGATPDIGVTSFDSILAGSK